MAEFNLSAESQIGTSASADPDGIRTSVSTDDRPRHECLCAIEGLGHQLADGTIDDTDNDLRQELTIWLDGPFPVFVASGRSGEGPFQPQFPPAPPMFQGKIAGLVMSFRETLGRYGIHAGQTQFDTLPRPSETFRVHFLIGDYKLSLRGVVANNAVTLGITTLVDPEALDRV